MELTVWRGSARNRSDTTARRRDDSIDVHHRGKRLRRSAREHGAENDEQGANKNMHRHRPSVPERPHGSGSWHGEVGAECVLYRPESRSACQGRDVCPCCFGCSRALRLHIQPFNKHGCKGTVTRPARLTCTDACGASTAWRATAHEHVIVLRRARPGSDCDSRASGAAGASRRGFSAERVSHQQYSHRGSVHPRQLPVRSSGLPIEQRAASPWYATSAPSLGGKSFDKKGDVSFAPL